MSAALELLGKWMDQTIREAGQAQHEDTRRWAGMLTERVQRVSEVTRKAWSAGDAACTLANATAYLEAFGHVVLAWIWLDQACAAHGKTGAFYDDKRQACRYFFKWELPRTGAQFDLLASLDDTTLAMRDDWF